MQTNTTIARPRVIRALGALKKRSVQGVIVLAAFGALLSNVAWNFWQDRPVAMSDPSYLNKDRLQRHADKGEPDAQYLLGNLYFSGHTVKADEKEAARLFTLAAKQGHPLAQYQLGIMLQLNNNHEEAFNWLKKAAAQNIISAQVMVGNYYVKGTKTQTPNGLLASQYFYQAADQGDSTAMYNLAHMYKNGAGIPKDDVAALTWVKLAVNNEKNGTVSAQMNGTLADWEAKATKKDKDAAEKAVADRTAKGFTRRPVLDATNPSLPN